MKPNHSLPRRAAIAALLILARAFAWGIPYAFSLLSAVAFVAVSPLLLLCYAPRFWAWVRGWRWPRRLVAACILAFCQPRPDVDMKLWRFCYPND